ncbi:MAG: helix-turn-helix transcriptional regulator, partial [Burkholderiales bacterium]|nr:helix-turn-helix transcriptional regulator [Burkholderiales bacterium]
MKPTTSLPMSSEDRRAATVSAVVELASEHNPTDITTAAIAAKMGVTQGALFRHFASKDAVLSAVMEWVSARLLGRLEAAAAGLVAADQAL